MLRKPSINDGTPELRGKRGLQKLGIWDDFQGITGITTKLTIEVMSFMDDLWL